MDVTSFYALEVIKGKSRDVSGQNPKLVPIRGDIRHNAVMTYLNFCSGMGSNTCKCI